MRGINLASAQRGPSNIRTDQITHPLTGMTGWFRSRLLPSSESRCRAPYRAVTHVAGVVELGR